ncbi:MAG: double zinc ribbon domain-containing protein [Hyphomicrobiales bacterium]
MAKVFLMSWPGGSWEATAWYVAFIIGSYVLALWLTLVYWTARDIRHRSSSPAVQAAATLLVLCFFLPGQLLYIVMRPRYTRAERYAMALEEEALRMELDRDVACPKCSRSIREDYLVCPACKTELKQPCVNCTKPLANAWVVCPYCGTERAGQPAALPAGREEPRVQPLPVPATPTVLVPSEAPTGTGG